LQIFRCGAKRIDFGPQLASNQAVPHDIPANRPAVVGAVLHFTNGRVGLQLRDQRPDIQFPGAITPFGGGVELGETLQAALARELAEELELTLCETDHHPVWSGVYVDDRGVLADYALWVVCGVPLDSLRVNEGFLCVLDPRQETGHAQHRPGASRAGGTRNSLEFASFGVKKATTLWCRTSTACRMR